VVTFEPTVNLGLRENEKFRVAVGKDGEDDEVRDHECAQAAKVTVVSRRGGDSLSKLINFDGLNNVIKTLQDVRFVDYGLDSGATKRKVSNR